MEKIFSFAWKGKRGIEVQESEKPAAEGTETTSNQDHYIDDEIGLQRKHCGTFFINYNV